MWFTIFLSPRGVARFVLANGLLSSTHLDGDTYGRRVGHLLVVSATGYLSQAPFSTLP